MVLGTFEKTQKFIRSNKNQSVLIAKIISRKKQKIANPQKKIAAKISCHTKHDQYSTYKGNNLNSQLNRELKKKFKQGLQIKYNAKMKLGRDKLINIETYCI